VKISHLQSALQACSLLKRGKRKIVGETDKEGTVTSMRTLCEGVSMFTHAKTDK
jgi:hypothetical protein